MADNNGYVVVFNKFGKLGNGDRLRGVYELKASQYDNRWFKELFYKENPKFPGDRIKYCKDEKTLNRLLNRVNNPFYEWR